MDVQPSLSSRAERLGSPVRSAIRAVLYLAITVLSFPVQALAVLTGRYMTRLIPRLYHQACARIFGFDVRVHGEQSTAQPTLFVSNHVSYTDILVLGSLIEGSFIAKAEVSDWPFFGALSRMARTVFVVRRGPRAAEQRDEIAARLAEKDNLILFPEGTSNDGLHVLPFKSALFAVAEATPEHSPLTVQPVSIAYTRLDGIPLNRILRPHFAWYGDMTLLPHLLTLLGLGRVTVHVIFHPPIAGDAFPSRKVLAHQCRRLIVEGVNAANRGTYDGKHRPLPVLPDALTP
jgi:1-acyl-sn-glycerol-3-phosphate acyltransferase